MISTFHEEATAVEFQSFPHKATFSFVVNSLINLN